MNGFVNTVIDRLEHLRKTGENATHIHQIERFLFMLNASKNRDPSRALTVATDAFNWIYDTYDSETRWKTGNEEGQE